MNKNIKCPTCNEYDNYFIGYGNNKARPRINFCTSCGEFIIDDDQ